MNLLWIAISMLIGDRVKFFALIFGVAFATLLMAQQSSFCIGLLSLSGNFVRDIREADVWVMREGTISVESALPMPSTEVVLRKKSRSARRRKPTSTGTGWFVVA